MQRAKIPYRAIKGCKTETGTSEVFIVQKGRNQMKVYNTLTRQKEEFVPMEEGKVKMYVCGPTVYDFIHIGNARPYVVFDTVRRYLEYKGYDVTYVQNFTDVDDKIINRANKENTTMQAISDKYIEEAFHDADGLNVRRATVHPRVTQEMDGIIEMVQTLIDKGFAYEDKGTVYYNTKMFPEYGKLSRKNLDELIAGASERVTIDDAKKNSTDFVLWKPKKEGEPSWPSPWGDGRPGWHIECSVMAKHHLGEAFLGVSLVRGKTGLAYRVLGDEQEVPGGGDRYSCGRRGPDFPAP